MLKTIAFFWLALVFLGSGLHLTKEIHQTARSPKHDQIFLLIPLIELLGEGAVAEAAAVGAETAVGAGALGAEALTGAVGAEALGTGVLGAEALGTEALGAGTLGAEVMGAGAVGGEALGVEALGAGALGAESMGAGAIGDAAVAEAEAMGDAAVARAQAMANVAAPGKYAGFTSSQIPGSTTIGVTPQVTAATTLEKAKGIADTLENIQDIVKVIAAPISLGSTVKQAIDDVLKKKYSKSTPTVENCYKMQMNCLNTVKTIHKEELLLQLCKNMGSQCMKKIPNPK